VRRCAKDPRQFSGGGDHLRQRLGPGACLMILMKHGHVNPRHLGRLKSGESAVGAELETEGILFSGKATILNMELSDLTTVKPFVPSFLDLKLPLHYLICNSNIMAPTEWLPSKKNFELQFATNKLSHFPLPELLLPKLHETMRS
jgi:NAD(P)-dependent dehydrogenase (short-subunit alcohol dehydrogenase family)